MRKGIERGEGRNDMGVTLSSPSCMMVSERRDSIQRMSLHVSGRMHAVDEKVFEKQ